MGYALLYIKWSDWSVSFCYNTVTARLPHNIIWLGSQWFKMLYGIITHNYGTYKCTLHNLLCTSKVEYGDIRSSISFTSHTSRFICLTVQVLYACLLCCYVSSLSCCLCSCLVDGWIDGDGFVYIHSRQSSNNACTYKDRWTDRNREMAFFT